VLILTAAVAAVLGIVTFMSSDNDAAPATTAIDAATLASTSGGGQVGGAVNPVITLVEYGDYQCPHCAEYHHIVADVMRRLPDELALEYHHYPIPVGPLSIPASQAAEAAALQGAFWEMHDRIFETQNQWSGRTDAVELFSTMAGQLGLDTAKFREDMQSQEIVNRVAADVLRGSTLGVSGTPTFFIGGQRLDYVPSTADEFEALIRSVMGR
jgi:protein-disulfide isomerase